MDPGIESLISQEMVCLNMVMTVGGLFLSIRLMSTFIYV